MLCYYLVTWPIVSKFSDYNSPKRDQRGFPEEWRHYRGFLRNKRPVWLRRWHFVSNKLIAFIMNSHKPEIIRMTPNVAHECCMLTQFGFLLIDTNLGLPIGHSVDTCWSLVTEQHNSPNSTSSTYKVRNGPNKARLARPVYPIWMLQSLEKRAQAIPCISLHLFEMTTENSMNALPQLVCSISICARSDCLQVKNDDCICSCHRFWHRCWYCKLRWLSLVKVEGTLAGCCHQSLWSLREPTVETRNLVVKWRGGQSYTRESCTVQGLQCPEGGMTAKAKRAITAYHWCQAPSGW